MNSEQSDAIRESNRRRAGCGKCGSLLLEVVDGSRIDGLPGLQYKHCGGCGWSQAITKRAPKVRLNK